MMQHELIRQGAESRLFKVSFEPIYRYIAIKERFKKSYRHPILDAKLTSRRTAHEARTLQRLQLAGVDVPALVATDVDKGCLYMEWVEGSTLRDSLLAADSACSTATKKSSDMPIHHIVQQHETVVAMDDQTILQQLPQALATMHNLSIIHGDLTTSNIMVRPNSKLVLIDFGLSFQSTLVEDKAVDLYVLERAWNSTHPTRGDLLHNVLLQYGQEATDGAAILRKLDEVRLRGRKKVAFG